MKTLYNIAIVLAEQIVNILSLFNKKLKLGVDGRKNTFKKLDSVISKHDEVLWFHVASLGEYEQGLPVFKALKKLYPNHKIVISFFSPSGYEIKKNNTLADVTIYIPFDTKRNVFKFLNLVNPNLVVFVKYEIWPNYLNELKKRNINTILISALFRKEQTYFKWYGSFMKDALFSFNHIFTQNNDSIKLLKSINYTNCSVSGDTRFDRVLSQLNQNNAIDFIEKFIDNKLCIVFGSSWPEDDKLFIDFVKTNQNNPNLKFIIAPHNIKPNYTNEIASYFKKEHVITYSKKGNSNISNKTIFILDTIGYLSRVYSYANITYIGGGAGNTGLHNILEPAVFGVPIIIGKNYSKFPEAKQLIKRKGVISVNDAVEFNKTMTSFINSETLRKKTGNINKSYITENAGAESKIMSFLKKIH